VLLDFREHLDLLAQQVFQELLAQLEILEYRGWSVALANLDKMVIPDSKVSLVPQAKQDRRVH